MITNLSVVINSGCRVKINSIISANKYPWWEPISTIKEFLVKNPSFIISTIRFPIEPPKNLLELTEV